MHIRTEQFLAVCGEECTPEGEGVSVLREHTIRIK